MNSPLRGAKARQLRPGAVLLAVGACAVLSLCRAASAAGAAGMAPPAVPQETAQALRVVLGLTVLALLPALSMYEHEGAQVWELVDASGKKSAVEVKPRLVSGDFSVLMAAAVQCCGVALVPEDFCAPLIAHGELEWVMPEYSTAQGTLHFVYPSRRGLLPAVRSFVDFLAERLPKAQAEFVKDCQKVAANPAQEGAIKLARMVGSTPSTAFGRPNE